MYTRLTRHAFLKKPVLSERNIAAKSNNFNLPATKTFQTSTILNPDFKIGLHH